MEIVIALIAGLTGSGVASIVLACLNRHWQKKDRNNSQIAAIVNAEKLIMIDQVKRSAKKYIRLKKISLDDKEHILEEYAAYKALGGNGHLDAIMNEINRLPVVDE